MEREQKQTWEMIMLIRTFVLKVINNDRKTLTHNEIVDLIAEKIEWSLKCAKNQSCGFIWTYGGQVSHLLFHLSSITFLLYIYRP